MTESYSEERKRQVKFKLFISFVSCFVFAATSMKKFEKAANKKSEILTISWIVIGVIVLMVFGIKVLIISNLVVDVLILEFRAREIDRLVLNNLAQPKV